MERGSSYISPYNSWLKFRAAKDLMSTGTVEHLDFEKIIEELFRDMEPVHQERKNMGMTYIYILKKPIKSD